MRRVLMALLLAAPLTGPLAAQPAPAPADLATQPVAGVAPATPVSAQAAPTMLKPAAAAPGDTSQPRVRSMIVFGTDPCPKSSNPDEIIVCARQPDEDRYRIPPQLRTAQVKSSAFQRDRSLLLGDAAGGAGGGVGSCSTVGPGGGTGCFQKQANDWGNH